MTVVRAGTEFSGVGKRHYRINPVRAEDYERLWAAVSKDSSAVRRVVHLWNIDAPPNQALSVARLDHAVALGVSSIVHLLQAAARAGEAQPMIWAVTRNAVAASTVSSSRNSRYCAGPSLGTGTHRSARVSGTMGRADRRIR